MGRTHVRTEVEPHTSDVVSLRSQRDIYRRNQTPVRDNDGRIRPVDIRPAGPETAGRHLDEISRRWGEPGVARSINGLGVTRGWSYAGMALRHASSSVQRQPAAHAVAANLGDIEGTDRPIFSAATSIRRSQPGIGVPGQVRSRLPAAAAQGLDDVRIHDDPSAHAAAAALGARAVTAGRSIFMGAGEYKPSTPGGQHLLAHEIAHAIQQEGAVDRPVEQMGVSTPGSAEEVEAERFADAVTAGSPRAPLPTRSSVPATSLMRVITFTAATTAPVHNDPGVLENAIAGTFQIAQGHPTAPHFSWTANVTIHGVAGDPFADFQVGPLQVLRNYWFNVWWGTGTNRTHRKGAVTTPIRDALTGNDWYADVLASANFAADADVRATSIRDSPGVPSVPLANPGALRVSTRGWFNYGVSFVSTFSARDTTVAVAPAAFRHLTHVYWNMSVDGNFDTTLPAGSQVTMTSGVTNVGTVHSGGSTADPPIIGGDVPNDVATITDT